MSNDLQKLFENIYLEMNLEVPKAIMTTLTLTLGLVSQRFLCSDKLFPLYILLYIFLYSYLYSFPYIFLYNVLYTFLIFFRKSSARQRLSLTVGTSRSPRIRNRFARPTEKRRTTISCTPSENPTKFRSTLSTIIFPSEL